MARPSCSEMCPRGLSMGASRVGGHFLKSAVHVEKCEGWDGRPRQLATLWAYCPRSLHCPEPALRCQGTQMRGDATTEWEGWSPQPGRAHGLVEPTLWQSPWPGTARGLAESVACWSPHRGGDWPGRAHSLAEPTAWLCHLHPLFWTGPSPVSPSSAVSGLPNVRWCLPFGEHAMTLGPRGPRHLSPLLGRQCSFHSLYGGGGPSSVVVDNLPGSLYPGGCASVNSTKHRAEMSESTAPVLDGAGLLLILP